MIRPLTNEDELQSLASMELDELRPDFVDQVGVLRKKVINKIKPKMLNGQALTGPMLLDLFTSYVDSINKGSVPNIQQAWIYICKNECQKALNEAERDFEKQLKEGYELSRPMFPDELE